MHLKHLTVGAVVYVALLIAAPAGVAQTAAQPGYSAPAGSVQQQLGPDGSKRESASRGPRAPTDAANSDVGSLPFTGLDLGFVGGAGAMLLAIGLAVRRLVGSQTP
jgi:hypothetical protein